MQGFSINLSWTRSLAAKSRAQNAITYELSMSRTEFTRSVYGLLDFMADLGGLFAAIGPLCKIFILSFQYRGVNMLLMDLNSKDNDKILPKQDYQFNCCRVLCLNLRLRCPKMFSWSSNQKQFIVTNSYKQIEKEVQVSYILQQLRVLKIFALKTIPKERWQEYFNENKNLKIDNSSSDADIQIND